MRYLESFNEHQDDTERQRLIIEDIEYSLVELIDRGFTVEVIPFYITNNGIRVEYIYRGLDIRIDHTNLFKIDDIINDLDDTKEYIKEKYNMKFDFVYISSQFGYMRYKSFDEIKNTHLQNIRITFKPIGILTKAKNYIINKFK